MAGACRCAQASGCSPRTLSFIGVPVVTVPVRRTGALPIGVQLIAAPWREDQAFRVAAYVEREGASSA
jgi:Asp-tRNA(Asn)/Glu-tRNA(Gln) amidotransferase A subunit family amidase